MPETLLHKWALTPVDNAGSRKFEEIVMLNARTMQIIIKDGSIPALRIESSGVTYRIWCNALKNRLHPLPVRRLHASR